jgi:hypothetical protein
MIRDSSSKNIYLFFPVNQPEGSAQLYSLVNDPHERNDLAQENPEILSRIQTRLEEWGA